MSLFVTLGVDTIRRNYDIVIMTSWSPDLDNRAGPRYRAIADAIAEDIAAGRLSPGTRMPTHRDLAWRLGVTIGTVTRAYLDAERRGLVAGEVGRGTFVKEPPRPAIGVDPLEAAAQGVIDMSISAPLVPDLTDTLAREVASVMASPGAIGLLGYVPWPGLAAHRVAGAAWMARFGAHADPATVQVTTGGQSAMAIALATVAKPGDLVLTEALTYPGFKAAAGVLGLRLHGVAMDEEGLIPEAFENACRQGAPRAIYLMPTIHNPTCAILPPARREAIAAIARRHDVTVIEDDVFGCLVDAPPPPVHRFGPDNTIFLTALSKSVAPGLRIGFMAAPARMTARMTSVSRALGGGPSPVLAEVARRWIEDGRADRFAAFQRDEARDRQRLVRPLLGHLAAPSPPSVSHLWLSLPDPWRRDAFTAAAAARRVRITPADAFMVGRGPTPHAVRVSLCATRTREEMERGAAILAGLVAETPDGGVEVV
jgi:DNA-binding transcriptional MocR family regulator